MFIPSYKDRSRGLLEIAIMPGCRHLGQHLYFTVKQDVTNPLSIIKEGDWYIDDVNAIRYSVIDNKEYWSVRKDYVKIIATTDPTLKLRNLTLPTSSSQFINKFVEEYNKGNIITEVMIEFNDEILNEDFSKTPIQVNIKQTLKVNSKDNTITIKKVKESWNLAEVKQLCWQAYMEHYCNADHTI